MKNKKSKDTSVKHITSNEWVDITVDIHDGWADDVSLVYPEGSWKPDDGELTNVNLAPSKSTVSDQKDTIADRSEDAPTAAELVSQSQSSANPVKTHYFRTFLIIWLGLLAIAVAFALGYFYDFLDSYEQAYQASRPYHMMESILLPFQDMDMDTVYKMQTSLPPITQFETENTVKDFMAQLLEGKKFSYEQTGTYSDDFPQYHILADGYVIATVNLRKSQTDHMEYDFPIWYVSSFEFYTQPLEEFYIEAPENYKIYVNGIELDDSYFVSKKTPDENSFVEPYVTLPDIKIYQGKDLYATPTVNAVNSEGTEYLVLPDEAGRYIISYPKDCQDAADLQEYAVKVVTTYANYVSQDAADNALDPYFPQDSTLLPLIKANTSRRYYASHRTPEIQNVQIRDFISYSDEAFYCEVYLEQSMVLSWGREPEIVPTDGRFYFVKINDEWKVSAIAY